jgi:mannosyl-oligosaccharide glucosidase
VAKYAAAGGALGSLQHLKRLHWDAVSSSFLDWGLHTEAVQLVKVTQGEGPEAKEVMVRQVLAPPKLQYVPAFGYVSLFPLLMQLLPPGCEELGQQLALLRQEGLLWTPYGLRSLAPTSSIYMK